MHKAFARRFHTCLASVLLATSALAAGCASPNGSGSPATAPSTSASASAQHAECLVCKENADLACVDVAVDKDTPHTDYNGKTYYFCSNECKHAFEKHPEKYAK